MVFLGAGGKRSLVKEKRGSYGVKVALQIPHIILNKSVVLYHENGRVLNPPSAGGRIISTRPIQAMADTTDCKNNLSWELQKLSQMVVSWGLA